MSDGVAALPPQMQNFTLTEVDVRFATIQQVVGLYNTAWMGLLITVAVALILFSTPVQRRRPIFAIQCLAFAMALTNTALVTLAVVLNFRQRFVDYDMTGILTRAECTQKAFETLTPLVGDITLIFKVLAFYPPTIHPDWRRRYVPVMPLIVLGAIRLIVCLLVTIFYYRYDSTSGLIDPRVTKGYGDVYHRASIAEFALQIAYCGYASALLFRKIFSFARHRHLQSKRAAILQRRLRYLIESLAMTFILPVIAQLVALVAAVTLNGNVLYLASLTNVYLSTLLSVLATSWSTIRIAHVHNSRSSMNTSDQRLISGGSAEKGQGHGDGRAAVGFAKRYNSNGSDLKGAGGAGNSSPSPPIKDDEHGQLHHTAPHRRQGRRLGSDPSDVDGEMGEMQRETLLARLFDDDDDIDEAMHGQVTSMEMLSSNPQISSGVQPTAQLPTRGTSGWRRGVLRT